MNDLKKMVGDFVRQCRDRAGKTQAEFAEAIGAHKQVISELERGQSLPSLERLCKIIEAADLEFTDCLSLPVEAASDVDEKKILRLFRSLSGKRRTHAISLVEDLAELQRHRRGPA